MDVGTIVGMLVFAAVCFAAVTFFVRGAILWRHTDLRQRRAALSLSEGE